MSYYPRNLYKSPGKHKWNKGLSYDTVLVNSEEDQKEAEKDGFIDSFKDALFPPVEVVDDTEDYKESLVIKANELGLGAKSTLRRKSVETLEKKIAEKEA